MTKAVARPQELLLHGKSDCFLMQMHITQPKPTEAVAIRAGDVDLCADMSVYHSHVDLQIT